MVFLIITKNIYSLTNCIITIIKNNQYIKYYYEM